MTDEEIDAICIEAMRDGLPLCPWIGKTGYEAHRRRQQMEGLRMIAASFAESARATRSVLAEIQVPGSEVMEEIKEWEP